jgi:hypothetical protein
MQGQLARNFSQRAPGLETTRTSLMRVKRAGRAAPQHAAGCTRTGHAPCEAGCGSNQIFPLVHMPSIALQHEIGGV